MNVAEHVGPQQPGQGFALLHEAVEQARRENEIRNDRNAAMLLASSMLATTGYAVWFVTWAPAAADRLVLFAAAGTVGYAVALALHGARHKVMAGVTATAVSATVITALAYFTSSSALFQLILLGVGLAVPLLLPPAYRKLRLASALTILAAFAVSLTFSAEAAPWLSGDEVRVAATVNQLGGALNIFMVGLLTHAGFARARSLLRAERSLHRREAETDQLTGLANRRPALERLRQLVRARDSEFSVALFDLDDFKRINDHHGHECGDEMLVAVGDALESRFRTGDLVCRWGGDEFLVILAAIKPDDAERVLASAVDALHRVTVTCGGDLIAVTASGGVVAGATGDDVDDLLAMADRALYSAKDAGRDRVESASPER